MKKIIKFFHTKYFRKARQDLWARINKFTNGRRHDGFQHNHNTFVEVKFLSRVIVIRFIRYLLSTDQLVSIPAASSNNIKKIIIQIFINRNIIMTSCL